MMGCKSGASGSVERYKYVVSDLYLFLLDCHKSLVFSAHVGVAYILLFSNLMSTVHRVCGQLVQTLPSQNVSILLTENICYR